MSRYLSVAELPEHMRAEAQRQLEGHPSTAKFEIVPHPRGTNPVEQPAPAKPSKYRNTRVTIGEETYDSKLEYLCHEEQRLRARRGEIGPVILRQVNFRLEGGVVYRADFVVSLPVFPFIEILDAKGCDTRSSINKRKQVKARYGVEVLLWKK